MERQIPCGIPRVFPFVRHGDDIGVQHMEPFRVPSATAIAVDEWMAFVLRQPSFQIEIVKLLAPQHSCQGLPVYPALIFIQRRRSNPIRRIHPPRRSAFGISLRSL